MSLNNRKIHRWLGLTAMAWLVILGITGVILDHPEWRWTKQWTLTEAFASQHVLEDEVRGVVLRQFQVNPEDQQQWIAGAERGTWRSNDGGQTWQDVEYAGAKGTPRLFSVEPEPGQPWARIYLATDDGIWVVNGGSGAAQRFALRGLVVTQLVRGSSATELAGVVDQSRIFRFDLANPNEIAWTDLDRVSITNQPTEIGLSRIATDLHFGNGIARGNLSVLISDFGGIAIAILATTGFLQWLLLRRGKQGKNNLKPATRNSMYRWLFRSHAPIVGLLAIIPILYLSLTGIVFDHARQIMDWTSKINISTSLLPTAYRPTGLSGELRALAVSQTDSDQMWVMTRLGLLESQDGGLSWAFDLQAPLLSHLKGGLIGMTQRDGVTFVGTHGGPNFFRTEDQADWQPIPGLRMMIQDAVHIDGQWTFKGSRSILRGTMDGNFERLAVQLPAVSGLPVYNFLVDLHTGLMFHDQWIWVNDLAAIVAIVLAITGFLNWLRRKWI